MFSSIKNLLNGGSTKTKNGKLKTVSGEADAARKQSVAEDFNFIPVSVQNPNSSKTSADLGNNYLQNINAILGAQRGGTSAITESESADLRTNDRQMATKKRAKKVTTKSKSKPKKAKSVKKSKKKKALRSKSKVTKSKSKKRMSKKKKSKSRK